MTEEEKELLIKDLCARFPYHPFVHGITGYTHNEGRLAVITSSGCIIITGGGSHIHYFFEEVKPYLRPLSTMSAKERRELRQWGSLCMTEKDVVEDVGVYGAIHSIPAIDWLNEHHFDYRGLIEKGLALAAPEGMYKLN